MSHVQVQRVVVRMLYDPAFAAEVYAAPDRALAGLAIDAAERRWLVAPDPRAYRTDPYRRARALQGLIEEYPAACAVAVRRSGLASLDAFFSSALFHGCIQDRGSLAGAFGRFLEEHGGAGAVGALARLERGLAAVRRTTAPPPPAAGPQRTLRLSPCVEIMTLPEGTFAHWEEIVRRLHAAGDVLQAVLRGAPELPDGPSPQTPAREHLLVEPRARGERDPALRTRSPELSIEHAPPALAGLLEHARTPRTREALAAEALRLGAEPDEAAAVLDDVVAQGLLVAA